MPKLTLENVAQSFTFAAIGGGCAAALTALIGLVTQLIIPFSAVGSYIFGGVAAILIILPIKRFLVHSVPYFTEEQLQDGKGFWLERMKSGRFIKAKQAYATFIPCFIVSIGMIVLAVLLPISKANSLGEYIWKSAVCGCIGGGISASALYIVFGIKALSVCPSCKAVNAFIYDEDLNHSAASGYSGEGTSVSYAGTYGGIHYYGGAYNTKKFKSCAIRALRHCKCCNHQSVSSEVFNNTTILQ